MANTTVKFTYQDLLTAPDDGNRYEKEGVQEYWIADPKKETLEIYVLRDNSFTLFGQFSNSDNVSPPMFSELSFQVDELWQ